MCFLFVVCYISVWLICVVSLLNNFCLSLFFLRLIWCLYLQKITRSFVSLFFLSYRLNFHCALILVRSFPLFVFMCFFAVVSVLLHIKYLFVVCCMFFGRMSVLCCLSVEKTLFVVVLFTYCLYDVCILFLQTIGQKEEWYERRGHCLQK